MLLSVIAFNINSGSFAPVVHWSADHGFSQDGLTLVDMYSLQHVMLQGTHFFGYQVLS